MVRAEPAEATSSPWESVRVAVRLRPFSQAELDGECSCVARMDVPAGQVALTHPDRSSEPPKTFTFDLIYDEGATQAAVYEQAAFGLVDSVMEGVNGTVFVYGQTGCGKTFTMTGTLDDSELKGIMPRAFEHIFGAIDAAGEDARFLIVCSYIEIYNEEIRDLLNPQGAGQRMELKEHPEQGVYVRDLTKRRCGDLRDIESFLALGNKHSAVGATAMNPDSSRSHRIFCVYAERSDVVCGASQIRVAKLNLVDLAGSEKQEQSAGSDRVREATKINLSLSALGNVISALVDGRLSHVPFRDSKLTRLLQDSLGGNTKTVMVAAIGPADAAYEETLSTLRYASRARDIRNRPKVNDDPKEAMLKELQEEVKRLQGIMANGQRLSVDGFAGLSGLPECSEIVSAPPDLGAETVATKGCQESYPPSVVSSTADVETIVLADEGASPPVGAEVPRPSGSMCAKRPGGSRGAPERGDCGWPAERHRSQKGQRRRRESRSETLKETSLGPSAAPWAPQMMHVDGRELERLQLLEAQLVKGGRDGAKAQRQAGKRERLLKQQRQIEQQKRQLVEEEERALMLDRKYESLQEEAREKDELIGKLRCKYKQHQCELNDLREEFEGSRQELLEEIRENAKQLALHQQIIQEIMPARELKKTLARARWDPDEERWVLPYVAQKPQKLNLPSIGGDRPTEMSPSEDGEEEISPRRVNRGWG